MTGTSIILDPPHAGQLEIWKGRQRFNVLRCGRRFGKTSLAISILSQHAAKGQSWGLFAPDYKILSETYRDLEIILAPITSSSSKTDGLIRQIGRAHV